MFLKKIYIVQTDGSIFVHMLSYHYIDTYVLLLYTSALIVPLTIMTFTTYIYIEITVVWVPMYVFLFQLQVNVFNLLSSKWTLWPKKIFVNSSILLQTNDCYSMCIYKKELQDISLSICRNVCMYLWE